MTAQNGFSLSSAFAALMGRQDRSNNRHDSSMLFTALNIVVASSCEYVQI